MIDKTIKGIKYRLDEETLTAEVTAKRNGYEGDIIIPETVVFKKVAYRVTIIGEEAFSCCSFLTSIVIPDGVTSIGESAFSGCSSLKQKPTQEIEMSNVQYRLLMHNHLAMVLGYSGRPKTINIPSEINHEGVIYHVTSIGRSAFESCSSLTSITFNGTKAQWKGIKLGDDWNDAVPTKVIHCTDGEVEIYLIDRYAVDRLRL